MAEGQELGHVAPANGHGDHGHGADHALESEEFKIIQSTIELRDIKVDEIMINIDRIFSVSADATIDKSLLLKIAKRGYSKIPIYKGPKNNIIGIIPTKKFLNGDEYTGSCVEEAYKLSQPTFVPRDQSLLELLSIFQKGKTQTVFVTSKTLNNGTATPGHKFHSVYSQLTSSTSIQP
jgi:metal transporter CNNM